MREVDQLDDAVDERVPKCDEGDECAIGDADDDCRKKEVYLSPSPLRERGGIPTSASIPPQFCAFASIGYFAASSLTNDQVPAFATEPENWVSVVSPFASNDHLPKTPS